MQNPSKKLMIILAALISAIGLSSCDVDVNAPESSDAKNHVISKKDMPIYIFDPENMDTMPVFFIGDSDVPYVSLEDWSELYSVMMNEMNSDYSKQIPFSLEYSIDGNTAVLTRIDSEPYTMTVDCDADTITFSDYDAFGRLSDNKVLIDLLAADTAEMNGEAYYFKRAAGSYERYGHEVVINAGEYGIDFVADGDACYVPLQTMSDFLLAYHYANVYYNKESVCFAYHNTVIDNATGEPTEFGEIIYSVEPQEVSEAMSKFNYAELCLAFDNLYGLKEAHGLEKFDDLVDEIGLKSMFTSTDANDSDKALYTVLSLHLDDLHSGFCSPSPFNEQSAIYTYYDEVGDGRSYTAYENQKNKFLSARSKIYSEKPPIYEEFGNTAYITFDKFVPISPDTNYYETPPTEDAQDTIGIMLYAYSQITRKNSPIENVVLDLSLNTGGDTEAGAFVTSSFLGEGYSSLENTMSGALVTGVYNVDCNLDGKFDKKDNGLANKKLFCLISPVSFSCGNTVPSIFKNSHDVTLLGQTSAGGSCVVLPMTTATGTYFQLSGPLRQAFTKNGSFYNIDQGADPDYFIAFPEDYYNREGLTEYINNLW